MTIIYLILGIALLSIAFLMHNKKENIAKAFKRQAVVILSILNQFVIVFSILGVICLICMGLLIMGIILPKWIAIVIVFIILITSMILSFRLSSHLGH